MDEFELINPVRIGKFIDNDGTGFNLKQIGNKVRVSSMPYLYDIAEGNVADHIAVRKFGHNSAVGTAEEPIWDASQAYTYMTSASTLYISSSDTNDDQDYEVTGLDANWDVQTETVTANGFNFVAISGTWMRVFRAKNMGTTDNAGNIYISDDNTDVGGDGVPDTASSIKAQVSVGMNQTLMAIWSVPDSTTFYMVLYYASTSTAKATEVYLRVRPFGGVFQVKKLISINAGADQFEYKLPLPVAAKSDIEIRALAAGGGGEVSAGFDGWYE